MLKKLQDRLKELNKVAISFSGGIDSSFLLYVARITLPTENVLAIIANGNMVPRKDYEEAIEFLKENKINYKEIEYKPLEIEEFKENRKDRCYYCKKKLMIGIKEEANKNGFENVLDGKNEDDLKVYRPGNKATEEIGIISPLAEIGFSKENIREESKKLGLKIWNKPSNSCLATRFPYNTILTEDDLKRVEQGEEVLKKLGIPKVRIRVHQEIARIEVEREYSNVIIQNQNIVEQIKALGFRYVTLDLNGLTSGSFDK
ncbi:MAG: ATP-dependent sacrificial sulfur transferase LarE [Clostridium sp.]|nr:ATP-dependent sacrificial sulfur transferase LarE [Clostridium sp.]